MEAVPAGGYDQSQFESTGPALTAKGMGQSYSADGAFTVFESDELLTPDAVGPLRHVYRRSASDGTLELVSRRVSPAQPQGSSFSASISADGRWIAYQTTDAGVFADDLPAPGTSQIALVDMTTREVVRVSSPAGEVPESGDPGAGSDEGAAVSSLPMVSADGSTVVFVSNQPGMSSHGAATGNIPTVERFDRLTGRITNVSSGRNRVSGDMETADGISTDPTVSADGRYVAFTSSASNLAIVGSHEAFAAGGSDVYRWDAVRGTTERISLPADGDVDSSTTESESSFGASISADGNRVAFISAASDLVASDQIRPTAHGMTDAYLRVLDSATSRRLSMVLVDESQPEVPDSAGRVSPSTVRVRTWFSAPLSTTSAAISADGRSVLLTSLSPLLAVHGRCSGCQNFVDDNGALDVYQAQLDGEGRVLGMRPVSVKRTNQDTGNTTISARVRRSTTGGGDSVADGRTPATADGGLVAFSSQAGDLRGIASVRQIASAGPPDWLTAEYLPVYADSGEPDEKGEAVRTFTIAANSFNPHLAVPTALIDTQVRSPLEPRAYETRPGRLRELNEAPVRGSLSSAFATPILESGASIGYEVVISAATSGSAELVLELEGVAEARGVLLPAGWSRASSDRAGTITLVNPHVEAGSVTTITLQVSHERPDTGRASVVVIASLNGDRALASAATATVLPPSPQCIGTGARAIAIAGVPLRLTGVQCRPGASADGTRALPSTLRATALHGTVALDAEGTLRYTADPDHLGDDTITVTALDAWSRRSGRVDIPIGVTSNVVSRPDEYRVEQGSTLVTSATSGVLGNDTIPGGTELSDWRIQRGAPPEHGDLAMNDATGAFSFSPEPGFHGTVSFSYRVNGVGRFTDARSVVVPVVVHVEAAGSDG
ncbi:hypothetical protein GCM10009851_08160 [Herbiconiux moechotypicola]|uniref:Uncharacterized protein n=1 Tax=Herbiconiux moechotypicola TaxID=637393 RepID=A0ABN3DBE7_9MICO